ncbi:scarecrow-like protein 9 [Tanacetum coccineum]
MDPRFSNDNNVVSSNNGLLLDSPENISSEICDEDHMMIKFKEGVDEANKFNDNNVVSSNNGSLSKYENSVEGVVEESIKQDPTLRTKEIDLILLSSMGAGAEKLRMMRNTLRHETGSVDKLKDKEEVIDLTTLLVTCAQAVEADDTRNASELLRQIRQHALPFGDGSQRWKFKCIFSLLSLFQVLSTITGEEYDSNECKCSLYKFRPLGQAGPRCITFATTFHKLEYTKPGKD